MDSREKENQLKRKQEIMDNYYNENPVFNGEHSAIERANEIRRYLNYDSEYNDYGMNGGGY